MTDDTLREECIAWIQKYCPNDYHVDDLMAFARSQQAAGLREAAGIIDGELYRGAFIENALHAVEVQATARELGA